MSIKLISIGKAAKRIGVSIDTLRRWDKKGRLLAIRKSGKRFYRENEIDDFANKSIVSVSNLFKDAKNWAINLDPVGIEDLFYCPSSLVFQVRLNKFEKNLLQLAEFRKTFSIISSIVGEIGNNSFDHNLGSWRDTPGIFFGYDIEKREVVLADRGQGVLKTLQRVRPSLMSDEEALKVAFSEVISGRSPEARGNGLKFVRKIVVNNKIKLTFFTGSAKLVLEKGDEVLKITKQEEIINGCLAMINF